MFKDEKRIHPRLLRIDGNEDAAWRVIDEFAIDRSALPPPRQRAFGAMPQDDQIRVDFARVGVYDFRGAPIGKMPRHLQSRGLQGGNTFLQNLGVFIPFR